VFFWLYVNVVTGRVIEAAGSVRCVTFLRKYLRCNDIRATDGYRGSGAD
jgi:hypothetical protein